MSFDPRLHFQHPYYSNYPHGNWGQPSLVATPVQPIFYPTSSYHYHAQSGFTQQIPSTSLYNADINQQNAPKHPKDKQIKEYEKAQQATQAQKETMKLAHDLYSIASTTYRNALFSFKYSKNELKTLKSDMIEKQKDYNKAFKEYNKLSSKESVLYAKARSQKSWYAPLRS